ncbi:MAG: acyltransferase family protein [Pseudomonadota bacterium]
MDWAWQRRARRLHLILVAGSAGLIVTGSLVPFSWQALAIDEAIAQFLALWSEPAGRLSRIDVAVNVVITVPLAYALLGACQLSYVGRAPVRLLVALTLVSCAALTFFVEFAQLFVGARVPSSSDVYAQIVGAAGGILLWRIWGLDVARLVIGSGRGETSWSAWSRALSLYTIGILIYALLPLDLTISPAELYGKWKSGSILIAPFQRGDTSWVRWFSALFFDTAIWIPVGVWVASRRTSVRRKLALVALLPAAVECAQIFVESRVVDVTDVLLGTAGAAIGFSTASRWLPSEAIETKPRTRTGSGRWYAVPLGLGLLTVLVFTFPYDFQLSPAFIKQNIAALGRAPLESGLRYSLTSTLFEGIRIAVVFGLLGASVAMALARSRLATITGLVPFAAAIYGAIVATAIETAKLALPNRVNDLTDVILAAVFAGTACALLMPIASATRRGLTTPARRGGSPSLPASPSLNTSRSAAQNPSEQGSEALRIPSLDGLRALAAAGVFAVHWQQLTGIEFESWGSFSPDRLFENGNTGVALFFVLSGFLLSLPLWHVLRDGRSFSYGAYALRRVARIIPAYYGCLFALLIALAVTGQLPKAGDIVTHLLLVHHWFDSYFYSINAPFWTIGVEAQFYVLLAAGFGALRLMRAAPSTALSVVFVAMVVSFLVQYIVIAGNALPGTCALDHKPHLSRSLTAHLPIFLTGVALAYLWLQRPPTRAPDLSHDLLLVGAAAVCLGILATPLDNTFTICGARYNFPVITIALAVLVYSSPRSHIGRAALDNRVMVYLGGISYGFYLFHLPVQKAVKSLFQMLSVSVTEHWLIFGVVSAAVATVVSAGSHRWFERPILEAIRRRFALTQGT